MNTKHTPGPWTVSDEGYEMNNWGTEFYWYDVGPANVPYNPEEKNSKERALIDANLIAAAPELLELLKRGIECGVFDGAPVFMEDVQAVIAKAEGLQS